MICNLLAALLTMVVPFLEPPPDQPESVTVPVALVSDESGLVVPAPVDDEEVTVKSLARNFQAQLDAAEHLSVYARYKFMSYEVRPQVSENPDAGNVLTNPVSLNVDIYSRMAREGVESVEPIVESIFKREGVEKPIVSLKIGPEDASVEYYYWEAQKSKVKTFKLSDLDDDFIYSTDDDPLLSGLWSQCDGAPFWRTWLPSTHDYWEWEKHLSWGDLSDEPVTYNSKPAWRITVNRGDNSIDYSASQSFYIDVESGLLVGWQKFIVVTGDKGSFFHAGDATFEYDFMSNSSVSLSE